MKIKNGNTYENAYSCYLEWFRGKATMLAKPKDKEQFLEFQIGNEDVFENETIVLNRVFFFVPLFPSESKSGRLEIFTVSELNLLKKAQKNGGDIKDVVPVEYERYGV